jgi:uncharacterized protein (TIGR02246 family)
MANDKQLIRDLIDEWARASLAEDLERILALMDDDAVFLRAGQPPMRGRNAFAEQFQQMKGKVRIEANNDIQEIEVSDDLAYCWNELSVTITPLKGGASMRRRGPTLTIFRKQEDGKWVLSRDANLLAEQ